VADYSGEKTCHVSGYIIRNGARINAEIYMNSSLEKMWIVEAGQVYCYMLDGTACAQIAQPPAQPPAEPPAQPQISGNYDLTGMLNLETPGAGSFARKNITLNNRYSLHTQSSNLGNETSPNYTVTFYWKPPSAANSDWLFINRTTKGPLPAPYVGHWNQGFNATELGLYQFKVAYDEENSIGELNESNNIKYFNITCLPQEDVDLTITGVRFLLQNDASLQQPVSAGHNYKIVVDVANNGAAPVSDYNIIIYWKTPYREWDRLTWIGPNRELSNGASFPANSTFATHWNGTYLFRAVVDESNAIPETNNHNNQMNATFATVNGTPQDPNICVLNVEGGGRGFSSNAPLAVGANYSAHIQTCNGGTQYTSSYNLSIYWIAPNGASWVKLGNTTKGPMDPDYVNHFNAAFSASLPGIYQFKGVLDETNVVAEYNESNNIKYYNITAQ
ncbi:MAG: CARDB domain-containing protein, partial [Candidatus Micrarchaeota archaeon]